jgi:hypothetical protein
MKTNKTIISRVELQYLNKWLLRTGKRTICKYRYSPEVLLNMYEHELTQVNKFIGTNDGPKRLKVIVDYIDYITRIEPIYKRFLKLHNMKGYEFGLMLGYKNQLSWHKSYKRYTYIRAIVTMIDKHEALLTRLNNPK